MRECLGCVRVLTRRSQRLYCSVKCMQMERARILTERWLATGQAHAGTHAGHYVRDYIQRDQRGCCATCGIYREWQGRPLSLVLDHVDGNASNNRRENLRLICPSCDSQQPTFKSRNTGSGRHWRRQRYAEGRSY